MKQKALSLIEIITVIAIVLLLASLSGLAIKTFTDSQKTICSIEVIDSLLSLGRATAIKEGTYAGIYFYDQNDTLCTMEVVALYDYTVPYIPLARLDGTDIKEIGTKGDVNEAVVLFSPSGRLVMKNIRIAAYHNNSSRTLTINGKNYYINSYTGSLINKP